MTTAGMKALFELGVAVGALNARIDTLIAERDEARAVIRHAAGMADDCRIADYRIADEVLRPYIARYPLTPEGA